jgi:iron(III) transport system permease protein
VALTMFLLWLEKRERGHAGYQTSARRWQVATRERLQGPKAWLASLFCLLVFAAGFGIPIGNLLTTAFEVRDQTSPVWEATWNSVRLAGIGASATFVIALMIALGARNKRPIARFASVMTASGYAVPGAVLALGALFALAHFGFALTGTAALFLLVAVYVSRFAAAGTSSMEAALERAPTSFTHAARSLGASSVQRAFKIDLPIMAPGAAAAALILFVEILKELPATLMLRPFNWDTLAVRAFAYASDERLAAAALPSLAITMAGLLPVILLSWRLSLRPTNNQTESPP